MWKSNDRTFARIIRPHFLPGIALILHFTRFACSAHIVASFSIDWTFQQLIYQNMLELLNSKPAAKFTQRPRRLGLTLPRNGDVGISQNRNSHAHTPRSAVLGLCHESQ